MRQLRCTLLPLRKLKKMTDMVVLLPKTTRHSSSCCLETWLCSRLLKMFVVNKNSNWLFFRGNPTSWENVVVKVKIKLFEFRLNFKSRQELWLAERSEKWVLSESVQLSPEEHRPGVWSGYQGNWSLETGVRRGCVLGERAGGGGGPVEWWGDVMSSG